MENQKNSKSAIRLPIYIGIAISVGVLIGANMAGSNTNTDNLFGSVAKFRQVLTLVHNDYVDDIDTEKLVETAIVEMLSELDPHSIYLPAEDSEISKSQLQGNFEGIGVEFNIFKDTIYVVSPISGGPSESLGIMPGDKIVTVDDELVAGVAITSRGVIDRLRGERGSKVKVEIKRKGEEKLLEYVITRDVIPQYSVDVSYMVNDEVGYIKVSRFAATTYMEFKEALGSLQSQGMSKLILDLTGNPGGRMNVAINMVDEFLMGNQMIVYTKGKSALNNDEYYSNEKGDFEAGAVIVLIDEGSASASEIVSGALQDHDRALIVGRRSYGKGLVQLPMDLNDGSSMILTIARYYTPSGRSIQKPYGDDSDAYLMEYYNRFSNGEIYSQDSIKLNDSLVYKTDNGRLVYGGGGIMPDYFVPLDTMGNSSYIRRLFNSNSIAEFSLSYVASHRSELEKMSLKQYLNEFEITQSIIEELKKVGEENGVPFEEKDFNKSQNLLKIYTKAFIARHIWKNDGFFPIYNEQNEIFQKALTLVDEASLLSIN
ncbi:MAG: carboxyl-terminal processing protease [Marinoscillum sp.]